MKNKVAGCLFTLLMAFSIGASHAQQKELRKLRLNVFRTDAATVAARARGLFAAEGLEVAITTTPNSTDQMRGISNGTYDIASTAFDNVWLGPAGRELRLLRLRKSPTEPSYRFSSVPRSIAGAISRARNSRLTPSTRRLRWCSGAFSSRTAWISIAATMSSSR